MRKYLLPEEGSFYKVNLHCHTTISDGRMTPEEIKALYQENGYSAVAFTDHDVFIPHPELTDESFVALHGYEMEVNEPPIEGGEPRATRTCHMCLVALDPENETPVCWHREKYIPKKSQPNAHLVKFDPSEPNYERVYSHEGVSDMMRRGREAGFFVTYNHPTWSLEHYPEYSGYKGMHAMEIMNHACIVMGYPEYNERVYDDILLSGNRIFVIGADDTHHLKDACGAYVMVKAPRLGYRELTSALVDGSFYASEGPEIKALYVEGGELKIETSPVKQICLSSGLRRASVRIGENGETITSAAFPIPEEATYIRLTVIGADGKKAYTNAYGPKELLG